MQSERKINAYDVLSAEKAWQSFDICSDITNQARRRKPPRTRGRHRQHSIMEAYRICSRSAIARHPPLVSIEGARRNGRSDDLDYFGLPVGIVIAEGLQDSLKDHILPTESLCRLDRCRLIGPPYLVTLRWCLTEWNLRKGTDEPMTRDEPRSRSDC